MFRSLRHLARLATIARTLARHNALPADQAGALVPGLAWLMRRMNRSGVDGRPGERLARALTELGPGFVKLGQALSTRSDLMGEQMAEDLGRLRDRLPPFPGALARTCIAAELGRPLEEIYNSFDDTAVAAASIAQVHFAVTSDGRPVAVKILRPGVEAAFARDLALMEWLAGLGLALQPRLARLKPVEVVRTVADSVALEMDLRMEASAAAELAENFTGDPQFSVPAVDWDRTARRVLTLERVQGVPCDRMEPLQTAGLDPKATVKAAGEAFFRMVFRDGFFHADLHPGNLFVTAEGRLIAVDFGIMGRIDRKTRLFLADMLIGFLNRDYDLVARVHFDAGFVPASQSLELFRQACRAIGEPVHGRPLHEISVGRLLAQLFAVTEQFQMETQPQLLLLQKSMLTAEGVGRVIDPTVNIWELSRPLIERWMMENRGPEARIAEATGALSDVVARLPRLLKDAEMLSQHLSEGGVMLHPATVAALADAQAQQTRNRMRPVWVALATVLLLVIARG